MSDGVTGELHVEVACGQGWQRICALTERDRPGTMSHNNPEGREVILFACHGDHSTVERSVAGIDVEIGNTRALNTAGLEKLARLGPGQKLELWLRTDRMRRPGLFRFRHEDRDAPPERRSHG